MGVKLVNKTMKPTEIDLAVINTKLEYIQSDIKEIKESLLKMDDHERRLTTVEGKVSSQAVFQSVFSVIAATIAGFLGRKV